MNGNFLIVALCACQLATAGPTTNVTQRFQDDVKSKRSKAQAQADSASQQVQDAAQSTYQNITLDIQTSVSNAQSYAESLNLNTEQAKVCLSNQTQQYATIGNVSQNQIQQLVSSANSEISSAFQNFTSAANNANNNISNINSEFGSCKDAASGTVFLGIGLSQSKTVTCTGVAEQGVKSASAIFDTAFKEWTQILSQISSSVTGGATAQELNQTTQSAHIRIEEVYHQTVACLIEAAASSVPGVIPVIGPAP